MTKKNVARKRNIKQAEEGKKGENEVEFKEETKVKNREGVRGIYFT